jgi:hypothetical protein
MPAATSLGRTLVLAAVVHAAIGVFVAVRRPHLSHVDAADEPQKLIWVDSTPLAPEPEVVPPPPGSDALTPDTALANASRPERSTPIAAGSAVALPESAPLAPGGWTLNVTTNHPTAPLSSSRLAALALDGKNHFLGDRPPDVKEDPEAGRREANRHAGEAMRTALHDQDVARGLGGGGAVVTALKAAVLASTAPLESHAILIAIADASGVVMQVDVESASDDPASFRAIADDVLARLRGQSIRVPAGAHGLAVRIGVESKVSAPSGGGVGLDPKSAGGHFDLSDIGARSTRVIHAHILAEQIL